MNYNQGEERPSSAPISDTSKQEAVGSSSRLNLAPIDMDDTNGWDNNNDDGNNDLIGFEENDGWGKKKKKN